jgi:hypothetical protein
MTYTIMGKCPLCDDIAPLYSRFTLYICGKCRNEHPYEAPRLTTYGSVKELAGNWKATVWQWLQSSSWVGRRGSDSLQRRQKAHKRL